MLNLSVDEAFSAIIRTIRPLDAEVVSIFEALGRVLGEKLISPLSLPLFTNSAMDGYAIRAEDVSEVSPGKGVALEIIGELPAGKVWHGRLGLGQAIRIMTGAPIPAGADAVVKFEDTDEGLAGRGQGRTANKIVVYQRASQGTNIRPAGEDLMAGDTVIEAGTRLNPAHLGLLASLGISKIKCLRRPRVAILATGSELLEPGQPLEPGKIYNFNDTLLFNLVKTYGGEPVILGAASDDWEVLQSKLTQVTIQNFDLVLTSGGVSIGDYDMVKQVLQASGELQLWQVQMRPGKPLAFGELQGVPLLGLPGNPMAALAGFELFGRPALLKMQGLSAQLEEIKAILAGPLTNPTGKCNLVKGKFSTLNGRLYVWPYEGYKPAQTATLAKSNCLIVAPAERKSFNAGDTVGILPLVGDFRGSTDFGLICESPNFVVTG